MRGGPMAPSPIKGGASPRIDFDADRKASLTARKSMFANISSSLLRPTKAFLVSLFPAGKHTIDCFVVLYCTSEHLS